MNTRHYVIVWWVSIELPRFLLSSWVHQVTPARRCRLGPWTIWMVICKGSPSGKAKWKIEIAAQKIDEFHIHAYNSDFTSSPLGPITSSSSGNEEKGWTRESGENGAYHEGGTNLYFARTNENWLRGKIGRQRVCWHCEVVKWELTTTHIFSCLVGTKWWLNRDLFLFNNVR